MAAKAGPESYRLLELQPSTVFVPNQYTNEPVHRPGSTERRDSPVDPEMPRFYGRPDLQNGRREPEYAHVPPRDNWEPRDRPNGIHYDNRGFDHPPPPGNMAKNQVYVLLPASPGNPQPPVDDNIYARCEPPKVILDTSNLRRKRVVERERYIDRDEDGCCSCWCWTIAFAVILAILAVGAAVTAIVIIKLNTDVAAAGARQGGATAGAGASGSTTTARLPLHTGNEVDFDVYGGRAGERSSFAIVPVNGSEVPESVLLPNETATLVENAPSFDLALNDTGVPRRPKSYRVIFVGLRPKHVHMESNKTFSTVEVTGSHSKLTAPVAPWRLHIQAEQHHDREAIHVVEVPMPDNPSGLVDANVSIAHSPVLDGDFPPPVALDVNVTDQNGTVVAFDTEAIRNGTEFDVSLQPVEVVSPNLSRPEVIVVTPPTDHATDFTVSILHPGTIVTTLHPMHNPIDPAMGTTAVPLHRLVQEQANRQAEIVNSMVKNAKEAINNITAVL